jgi:uncharacterized protein (TIGR03067 family)
MRLCTVVLLVACSAAVAQPGDEDIKKELKRFQGKWQATHVRSPEGVEQTDIENQLTTLEVDGDMFTMKTGSLTVKGTFTIDPTKKVKEIDVFFGDNKETVLKGIYEIKDDTRKSCFALPGKDRPTAFSKDKGFQTLEWRADK